METIAYACHTAYLDPMTGSGLLVRPNPRDDIYPGGLSGSLHEADWNHAMKDLDARGWEPSENEDGDGWVLAGHTKEGNEVIGLYGREPIIGDPSIEQMAEAFNELHRLVGVVDA